MKKLMTIVLACSVLMQVNAQKVVKSTDFKLSDFEKINTPSQIVALKLGEDNKIMVYSLKLIPGVVKAESTSPAPKDDKKKGAAKLMSALGGVSTFSGNDARIGLPYVSERSFDVNHQQVASQGELMLIAAKEDNMKYSFEPNFFADGITKKMEVKTSVTELNKKNGFSLDNQVFINAGIAHEGKGFISDKDAKAYFFTASNSFVPNPSNGMMVFTKKVDSPNKEALNTKLPYVSFSTNLELSKTLYQGIVYENKPDDKWSSLKNFRLITVTNEGKLLNDENMNLRYVKRVQDFMPIYGPKGETKGTLIVFTKQAAASGKDSKDPIEGNRNIFVSDENGKIWTKFDYQHAKGEGFQPFSAVAAMMKNDKLYVLNSNTVKLTNSLLETVVFDKTGKAEVTNSLSAEKPNPKVFGTVGTRKYVTEAQYQSVIVGEDGTFYLIGQRYTSASDATTNPNAVAQYGDIFITELDADFKYKTHTIIALPNSSDKANFNFLEKKAGKTIISASSLGGDAVIIMEGNKINALTGIMPINLVKPTVSEWSNNYVYDSSKQLIHYIYQSKTEMNKAKIVTVSLVP